MTKSTSAAGKASNPPLLSLVVYSDDEEQTTPQGSQTFQSRLDVRIKPMTEKSDYAEPIIESTQVKMTPGNESEERDESEKTESEGVEEVDVEDVELLINIKKKAKSKKKKAPASIQRNNHVRKTTRKSTPSVAETQTSTPPTVAKRSSTRATRKSVNAELVAEHRYESFSSRKIIPERSVDLDAEDTWGFLDVINKGHLERTITGLVGYIPEIVKEFYAALPGEITRASKDRVKVTVRGQRFEFSPTKINEYLNLKPLLEEKVKADEMANALTIDEVAEFLTEGTLKRYRWLILPRTIFRVLQTQFEMQRKPREKRLGEIYLKNQKEEREAAKKAQRQAKKKGKSASTSTATPSSGPPSSTPRPERTDPSGYVPPRQSPRRAGTFEVIHLGSIAAPGQPIDAEEAKLALNHDLATIQRLMRNHGLGGVVGQIASMMFPSKSSIGYLFTRSL
ncbi:hypothetical protein Bca52824_052915 [Brassica carinata]|uniref:Uncharacterized protein n=1 Tax=Brassica carinata TaxID=52824 RepID=A0A8X7R738_BRACI|nr:hypothetical protein Bca52824_052915 [Brassica carinata]